MSETSNAEPVSGQVDRLVRLDFTSLKGHSNRAIVHGYRHDEWVDALRELAALIDIELGMSDRDELLVVTRQGKLLRAFRRLDEAKFWLTGFAAGAGVNRNEMPSVPCWSDEV